MLRILPAKCQPRCAALKPARNSPVKELATLQSHHIFSVDGHNYGAENLISAVPKNVFGSYVLNKVIDGPPVMELQEDGPKEAMAGCGRVSMNKVRAWQLEPSDGITLSPANIEMFGLCLLDAATVASEGCIIKTSLRLEMKDFLQNPKSLASALTLFMEHTRSLPLGYIPTDTELKKCRDIVNGTSRLCRPALLATPPTWTRGVHLPLLLKDEEKLLLTGEEKPQLTDKENKQDGADGGGLGSLCRRGETSPHYAGTIRCSVRFGQQSRVVQLAGGATVAHLRERVPGLGAKGCLSLNGLVVSDEGALLKDLDSGRGLVFDVVARARGGSCFGLVSSAQLQDERSKHHQALQELTGERDSWKIKAERLAADKASLELKLRAMEAPSRPDNGLKAVLAARMECFWRMQDDAAVESVFRAHAHPSRDKPVITSPAKLAAALHDLGLDLGGGNSDAARELLEHMDLDSSGGLDLGEFRRAAALAPSPLAQWAASLPLAPMLGGLLDARGTTAHAAEPLREDESRRDPFQARIKSG